MKIKKYTIECVCNNCVNNKNDFCNYEGDMIAFDSFGNCALKYYDSLEYNNDKKNK